MSVLPPMKLSRKLGKVIPTNKFALETWLADRSRNIAVSSLGVALLAAQITDLESRCIAMRRHVAIKRAQRACNKAIRGRKAGRQVSRA
jgi:hypothetical protein